MKRIGISTGLGALLVLTSVTGVAGPLDPDCDAGKAAKSAAMKATVGVGGRCTAAEAAKDTAMDAAGIEKKGPLEKKRKDDEGLAKKAVKSLAD
jgi:hypothetical protein